MTDAQQFTQVWKDAFAAYEAETKRKLAITGSLLDISSVEDLGSHIESSKQSFIEFRGRHRKLWDRLSACLKPISVVGGIVKGCIQVTPFAPSAPVINAAFYLLLACEKVAESYEFVEDVFAELQEFSDRLMLYSVSDMDAVMIKKCTAIMVFVFKILGRSEILILRGRFKSYLHVALLGKDEKTKKLVDDLEDLLKNEQRYILAATYAKSTGIKHDIAALTQRQEETELRRLQQAEDKVLSSVLEIRSTDRTMEIQAKLKQTLLQGTGGWIEKEPLFSTWLAEQTPILCIFGGPGCGKSHLSAWIFSHLQHVYDNDLGCRSIASFHIREDDEDLRDPNDMLKVLAWQIAQTDPVFRKHVAVACSLKRNVASAKDTWRSLFLDFYRPVRTIERSAILVIDGLDEAPKQARMQILELLNALTVKDEVLKPSIQVVVIGRSTLISDLDFGRDLKFIEVSSQKNSRDIDMYIEKRLSEIKLIRRLEQLDKFEAQKPPRERKRPVAPGVREKLKGEINKRADGVFLWAQLVIDQLHDKDTKAIEAIMNKPPKNLEDMIRRVFDRIADEEEDLDDLKRLLTWTSYARRPVLFGEIDQILSLASGSPNILLWDTFQGKLASIFELRTPQGYLDQVESSPDSSHGEDNFDGADTMASSLERVDGGITEENSLKIPDHIDDLYDSADEHAEEQSDAPFSLGLEIDRWQDSIDNKALETNVRAYSQAELHSVISFTHQQFRDFLIPPQPRPPILLDIDTTRAHLSILLDCFRILQAGNTGDDKTTYLSEYPAQHFVFHLEQIDPIYTSDEDKRSILDGLLWVFKDEDGIREIIYTPKGYKSPIWDELWATWAGTDQYTRVVRNWLQECRTSQDRLDETTNEWIMKASTSTIDLLSVWITTLARVWTDRTGFDDPMYISDTRSFAVWLMNGLSLVDKDGNVPENVRYLCEVYAGAGSAARLEQLADLAPQKHTTHWYAVLGWELWIADHNEAAKQHCLKALETHPNNWVASQVLAKIYGEDKKYELAIKTMNEAIEALPMGLAETEGLLLSFITKWQHVMGDSEGACKTAKKAFDINWKPNSAQDAYLRSLDRENRPQDIIQTLQFLDSKRTSFGGKPASYFVELVVCNPEVLDVIGRAYRATSKPRFIVDALDASLDFLFQRKYNIEELNVAETIGSWKLEYDDDTDASVKVFESVHKMILRANIPTHMTRRRVLEQRMARRYFDLACARHGAGIDYESYIRRLRRLATTNNPTLYLKDVDEDVTYVPGYASILWGRWLRDYEGAETSNWRKCFQARMLEELEMLDDNDPSNDMQGLFALAITLLHAGDEQNAACVLGILFKPVQDAQKAHFQASAETVNRNKEMLGPGKDCEASSDEEIANREECQLQEVDDKNQGEADEPSQETADRTNDDAHSSTEDKAQNQSLDNESAESQNPESKFNATIDVLKKPSLQLKKRWFLNCDGPCEDPEISYNKLYFCRVCPGFIFCDTCIKAVKNNTQVRRQCNPNHSWYEAWPIKEGVYDGAVDIVDDQLFIKPEWLKALRDQWL